MALEQVDDEVFRRGEDFGPGGLLCIVQHVAAEEIGDEGKSGRAAKLHGGGAFAGHDLDETLAQAQFQTGLDFAGGKTDDGFRLVVIEHLEAIQFAGLLVTAAHKCERLPRLGGLAVTFGQQQNLPSAGGKDHHEGLVLDGHAARKRALG